MRRAILARHGESERSVRGIVNGDSAVPIALTAQGREEAEALGRALAEERIDLCATSEFLRAQQTANIALAGRSLPRVVLPELNDIGFGGFEGRPLTEYRAWAHSHGPEDPAPGGGESRAETVARYVRGYRYLLGRPEETILVVAHGLPVRYVLDAVDGRNPAAAVAQVAYAEAFAFEAEALAAAVDRLALWVENPVWPT